MAIGIQNFPNINAPDSDYPNGRTRDRTLSQTGTPLNELTLGDMRQFFAKMMRQAAITPNGIPDNEYSGNQYFDAVNKTFDKYGASYIVDTSDLTLATDGENNSMFNAFVLVMPGASSGLNVNLPGTSFIKELTTITVVNDSSNSIAINSFDWALNHVVPAPTSTVTLTAGDSIEITFITISGQFNWIVSKKP